MELSDCFKSMPDFLLGCCSDINRVSSEKEDSVIYIEGNETCLIVIREGAVEHLFVGTFPEPLPTRPLRVSSRTHIRTGF